MLNLLTDAWLPVIKRQTGRCLIRPAQITEVLGDDAVIAIDWPRPDFRIATLEFLIGLLATAFPPQDEDTWLDWWRAPPRPEVLDEAFSPFADAFALDGDGPRFLQDLEELNADAEPVERLLIEAPGGAAISKNIDLMVHRGVATSLGRATAAITLYTLQSWAPAGGAGNRVGLRGGGPLVTMVVPGPVPTLWQTLWANVPTGVRPRPDEMPLVFPWLAPTVVSSGAKLVTPQTAHPLQCWWGMPRRIRLDFSQIGPPRACDLTGVPDEVHVVSWRQRPHGASYTGWGRVHPLTPHYQLKAGSEYLAVHPGPGGIGYRHWLGLVLGTKDHSRVPASAVSHWHDGRGRDVAVRRARLIAAGFDMDNMKARGFVESEMPLPGGVDNDAQSRLDDLASDLVMAAEQVATLLRAAVRGALFRAGAAVKADAALLNMVRERLWDETEHHFFSALEAAAQHEGNTHRADWLKHLRRIALALFDEVAPLSADCSSSTAPRIGKARRILGFALAGYGNSGAALFTTLQLPAVEARGARKKR